MKSSEKRLVLALILMGVALAVAVLRGNYGGAIVYAVVFAVFAGFLLSIR